MKRFIVTSSIIGMILMLCHQSAAASSDKLKDCLKRTEKERMECQSGCGMILHQCYEEEISRLDEISSKLESGILARTGAGCANLAKFYSMELKTMEGHIGQREDFQVGWIVHELTLKFARHRVENLRLIYEKCDLERLTSRP